MRHDLWFQKVSVGTIWLWLAVFALVPNAMVLVASLLQRGDTEFVRFAFTLESYRRLLDPLYLRVLWNSFYLAALSTLMCLALGYPFAFLLARVPARHIRLLLLLVIIPFWTSSLIRTYAMIIILKTRGVINNVLLWSGLIQQPLELLHNDLAVFIGLVYTLLPFMVLPLYASIEKLDLRLVEAARDLGAGHVRTFARVIIPLTLPGIIAGSMLVFLPALGMFYIPDLLGGARTLLVGNLIRNQFLAARDWPFGAAVSVVLTAVMAVLLVAYYHSRRLAERGDLA
ncbi:MAG TPA: spermidine/putrescine ABC transporter permease PotB [Syntrophobacteraceae bacterium]|nr:spermidine/putrescine ABC transporter permease PotB [Syntrophobacteraceae bacterium]